MKLGRIRGIQTFEQGPQGRLFSGMDIDAEYIDDKGKSSILRFHYQYYTNDVRGKVEQVLAYLKSGRNMPAEYSNVEVD